MNINIKYFGAVAETTDKTEEVLVFPHPMSLHDLESLIRKRYDLDEIQYRISVNKEFIKNNISLNNGDELAFLPPFAGG